jgi:hypothetical protein
VARTRATRAADRHRRRVEDARSILRRRPHRSGEAGDRGDRDRSEIAPVKRRWPVRVHEEDLGFRRSRGSPARPGAGRDDGTRGRPSPPPARELGAIGRGLSPVEPAGGVLVAFAARGRTVADDGSGGTAHSPRRCSPVWRRPASRSTSSSGCGIRCSRPPTMRRSRTSTARCQGRSCISKQAAAR